MWKFLQRRAIDLSQVNQHSIFYITHNSSRRLSLNISKKREEKSSWVIHSGPTHDSFNSGDDLAFCVFSEQKENSHKRPKGTGTAPKRAKQNGEKKNMVLHLQKASSQRSIFVHHVTVGMRFVLDALHKWCLLMCDCINRGRAIHGGALVSVGMCGIRQEESVSEILCLCVCSRLPRARGTRCTELHHQS